jgi:hypothetical protein
LRHRLSRSPTLLAAFAVGAVSAISFAVVGLVLDAIDKPVATASPREPTTGLLLARLGTAEIAAITSGVIFMLIICFLVFWGAPPRDDQR